MAPPNLNLFRRGLGLGLRKGPAIGPRSGFRSTLRSRSATQDGKKAGECGVSTIWEGTARGVALPRRRYA